MTREGEYRIAEALEVLAESVDRVGKALDRKGRAPREPKWAKRLEAMMVNISDVVAEIRDAADEHDAELQDVARALTDFAARTTINAEDTTTLEGFAERIRASTQSMKDAVATAEGTVVTPPTPPDPGTGGTTPPDQPPA